MSLQIKKNARINLLSFDAMNEVFHHVFHGNTT